MNRFVAAALAALALLAGAVPASAGVGVRVSGGIGYVSYGDFNDFAAYINDEVLAPEGVSGTVDAIHWIPEFSGEITIPLAPMLELGVGGGIVSGSSSFSFAVGGNGLDYKHTVKAYPFTATAYVRLPALPFAKPYAFAGAGAYYTKLTFEETVEESGVSDGFTADLTTWGFGLHGGAGLTFAVSPKISIDLGVKARWASFSGFSGTATARDGTSTDVFLASYIDAVDGRVFGPESTADAGTYPEGSVDLSGVAFMLAASVSF
jgi:opacity protein-like surface antigen